MESQLDRDDGGPGRDRTDDLFHAIVGGSSVFNNLKRLRELLITRKYLKTRDRQIDVGLELGLARMDIHARIFRSLLNSPAD
jgi:hypothetical protein